MYGKLFSSMFRGSLYGKWQAIVTFQQMIILADQDGTVDFTPEALSATTSIPLDIIQEGIKHLEEPDASSRSPGEEGRRIVLLNPERPWGWHIVNYAHYRAIRTAEERRAYHREYWRTKRSQPDSTTTQQSQPIAGAYASTSVFVIGLSEKTWEAFKEVRKQAKAKMTAHAENLLLEKLAKMAADGQNPEDVVNQSIERGWKGLFPVGDGKQKPTQAKGKIQRAIEACDEAFGPLNNKRATP